MIKGYEFLERGEIDQAKNFFTAASLICPQNDYPLRLQIAHKLSMVGMESLSK